MMNSANHNHRLLTPKQLAEELSVSQAWIRDHVSGRRRPFLPHIRLGGDRAQLRFRREDITEFLKMHTRNDNDAEGR